MQQSLQFLQAPAMELQSLVQQEIEINPGPRGIARRGEARGRGGRLGQATRGTPPEGRGMARIFLAGQHALRSLQSRSGRAPPVPFRFPGRGAASFRSLDAAVDPRDEQPGNAARGRGDHRQYRRCRFPEGSAGRGGAIGAGGVPGRAGHARFDPDFRPGRRGGARFARMPAHPDQPAGQGRGTGGADGRAIISPSWAARNTRTSPAR